MKRGKEGQSANEAALIVIFLTFFMIVAIAAVSDDIIQASDNNYRALLQDIAEVIESEANIAFASENGYAHSFTLPQTLNGQPYAVGIINSSSISDQANTTIIFVSSARPNVQLNVTRLLPRDVLGNLVIGPNTVMKERGIVVFRPLPLPLPTVSNANPSSGTTAGGTSVTVTGNDFVSGAGVSFGGVASPSVTFVSSNQLTAVTPAHAAGPVNVVVTNPDMQSGTLVNGFTYVPPPTVSSLSPGIGPYTGGTSVTITGSNFVATPSVTFGSVASPSVTFVSSTQLTVDTPPSAIGVGYITVTVTNPDGQSASAPSRFLYRISPVVVGTVFASSVISGGNLGGLSVADALCQAGADAGSFGGTWKAWLSTSTVNANSPSRITDTTYRKLDNAVVANSLADLTDGLIQNRINVTDNGSMLSGLQIVWTGTTAAGIYPGGDPNSYSCSDWTSSLASRQGRVGATGLVDSRWTYFQPANCNNMARLYCFRTS